MFSSAFSKMPVFRNYLLMDPMRIPTEQKHKMLCNLFSIILASLIVIFHAINKLAVLGFHKILSGNLQAVFNICLNRLLNETLYTCLFFCKKIRMIELGGYLLLLLGKSSFADCKCLCVALVWYLCLEARSSVHPPLGPDSLTPDANC